MSMNERQMERVEKQFAELGRQAVADAVERAKASGKPFVIGIDEHVVEVLPDGSHRVLKKLPPKVKVGRGRRIRLV